MTTQDEPFAVALSFSSSLVKLLLSLMMLCVQFLSVLSLSVCVYALSLLFSFPSLFHHSPFLSGVKHTTEVSSDSVCFCFVCCPLPPFDKRPSSSSPSTQQQQRKSARVNKTFFKHKKRVVGKELIMIGIRFSTPALGSSLTSRVVVVSGAVHLF